MMQCMYSNSNTQKPAFNQRIAKTVIKSSVLMEKKPCYDSQAIVS